ncbi:DUF6163 family protein [Bauldia sp.]|uniref:DUF6163 family protein n=1 Tax=Bauldia sp. TaxID=2575872 RepID=UPI003BAAD42C
MTLRENQTESQQPESRLALALTIYGRVMALILMGLGLRHWAVIVGVLDGPFGSFDAMPTDWKVATMHLAVVDLVAAVGLWQRVAWGNVVWIYAALAEVAMHTVFADTFGNDLPIIMFHLVTLGGYLVLYVLERREAAH